jgi:hypothetical protein
VHARRASVAVVQGGEQHAAGGGTRDDGVGRAAGQRDHQVQPRRVAEQRQVPERLDHGDAPARVLGAHAADVTVEVAAFEEDADGLLGHRGRTVAQALTGLDDRLHQLGPGHEPADADAGRERLRRGA